MMSRRSFGLFLVQFPLHEKKGGFPRLFCVVENRQSSIVTSAVSEKYLSVVSRTFL